MISPDKREAIRKKAEEEKKKAIEAKAVEDYKASIVAKENTNVTEPEYKLEFPPTRAA